MESLGSLRTIMGMLQDILEAVATASRNKSRCNKLAERVRCIKDILDAAAAAQDGTTTHAAATRRLEAALGCALQEVRRCQRGSSLLVRSVSALVAGGGRTAADALDGVEADIDRCILDLTLANSLRIAPGKNDDEKKRSMASAESVVVVPDVIMDTTTATAIGVPVRTAATTAVVAHEHEHEMVAAPPSSYGCYYGCCWSCRSCHYHSCCCYYRRDHGCAACDCRRDDDGDDAGGGPSSNAAALYRTQYSPSYPSMFSDDDPNSCSVM